MAFLFKEAKAEFQKVSDDGSVFPLLLVPEDGASTNLVESIVQDKQWLDTALAKHGAVLFRGFGLQFAEDFSRVVDALGWEEYLYELLGGMAARRRVCGSVLTVNEEFPLDQTIHFHNEAAYLDESPSKIMFFCLEAPEPGMGGATPIVRGRTVYRRLHSEHPAYLEKAEKGFKITLRSEFKTATEKMNTAPERYQKVLSLVKVNSDGEPTWFSSLGAARSYKMPIVFGDGSEFPEQVADAFFKVMEQEQVAFPWQKGDLLVLDNTAVLHSRQACTSSTRRILVSLAK